MGVCAVNVGSKRVIWHHRPKKKKKKRTLSSFYIRSLSSLAAWLLLAPIALLRGKDRDFFTVSSKDFCHGHWWEVTQPSKILLPKLKSLLSPSVCGQADKFGQRINLLFPEKLTQDHGRNCFPSAAECFWLVLAGGTAVGGCCVHTQEVRLRHQADWLCLLEGILSNTAIFPHSHSKDLVHTHILSITTVSTLMYERFTHHTWNSRLPIFKNTYTKNKRIFLWCVSRYGITCSFSLIVFWCRAHRLNFQPSTCDLS